MTALRLEPTGNNKFDDFFPSVMLPDNHSFCTERSIWDFWALLWCLCSGDVGELDGCENVLSTLPGVIYASVLTIA